MSKTKCGLIILLILIGTFTFGCSNNAGASKPTVEGTSAKQAEDSASNDVQAKEDVPQPSARQYKDGTYSAEGSYENPSGEDSIKVQLTIKNDIVTNLQVNGEADDEKSESYQNLFIEGIEEKVVGKDLNEIQDIGNVNGSGLTQKGFKEAIEAIKEDASE